MEERREEEKAEEEEEEDGWRRSEVGSGAGTGWECRHRKLWARHRAPQLHEVTALCSASAHRANPWAWQEVGWARGQDERAAKRLMSL